MPTPPTEAARSGDCADNQSQAAFQSEGGRWRQATCGREAGQEHDEEAPETDEIHGYEELTDSVWGPKHPSQHREE